jgi:signal transduction histidine kinase
VLWLLASGGTVAEPVIFKAVEASFQNGPAEDLQRTIDRIEVSPRGWNVGRRVESPQCAVFSTAEPIEADLIELTLCFMSGRPHAAFADFSLSITTDAHPSLDGRWEPLPILNFSATTSGLARGPGNRLLAEEAPPILTGSIMDDTYRITARVLGKSVTGFRIEVNPALRLKSPRAGPVMAWSVTGEFVLTEFRVEAISFSTNVALGAPVTATHRLYSEYGKMDPSALTDGWSSTIAHPADDVYGKDFFFEIDLGRARKVDHVALRQRGDSYNLDRFGRMWIKLYADDPKSGALPTWQVLNRPDGSFPGQGEVDILRSSDGPGTFEGRYIRISTDNPVPLSPMLAEVEVYETRTARLMGAKADDRGLPTNPEIRVPPGTLRLGFQFVIPQTGKPQNHLLRWRLHGVKETWHESDSPLVEIPCPPVGNWTLEVQAAHSDGTWDGSSFSVPMTILQPFTRSMTFYGLMAAVTLAIGGLIARASSQRRIAKLQTEAALSADRTRIARDLHDDLGSRLSQLAFLLKMLRGDGTLTAPARADVQQITEAAGEALESLDEVVWTVNPVNDNLDSLRRHLCNHATRYLSTLGIACRIECARSWPDANVSAHIRHQATMAFKEALQNVVKHSGATEVILRLTLQDGRIRIEVCDNGCGLPSLPGEKGRSGLKNMQERLAAIGGDCSFLPSPGGGLTVVMQVPLE